MPGPLVHFLEAFYPAYSDALAESIERIPTVHTLWMVRRILNSPWKPGIHDALFSAVMVGAGSKDACADVVSEAQQIVMQRKF